jgi:hypothetical protein
MKPVPGSRSHVYITIEYSLHPFREYRLEFIDFKTKKNEKIGEKLIPPP